MLRDLKAGRTSELIGFPGYESGEGERRIETCLFRAATRRLHVGRARGRSHRLGSLRCVSNGEPQPQRTPDGSGGQLLDARGKALLDPLQDEAIGRDQHQAIAREFQSERPNPGVELLRRQLLLEGIEAIRPERRRRHGASGCPQRMKKEGAIAGTRYRCHCTHNRSRLSTATKTVSRRPLFCDYGSAFTLTAEAIERSNTRLFCEQSFP